MFVYVLECNDNSLYTGCTKDIKKRLRLHFTGKGAKYVRTRLPATLVGLIEVDSHTEALKWEAEIKSWTREKKLSFIQQHKEGDLLRELQQEVTVDIFGRHNTN